MTKKLNLDTIIIIILYFVLIGVISHAITILLDPPTSFEENQRMNDVRLPSFTLVSIVKWFLDLQLRKYQIFILNTSFITVC